MRMTLFVILLVGVTTANAGDRRSLLNDDGDSFKYKSRYSNRQYQYDLSRPTDRLRYEVDSKAQIRDEMDIDPRREIEQDLGEYGGGVDR